MNRRVAYAAGAMLLAGLGSWASPAFSQGPMAPRMDVAPPPRVAPPPPPPPPVFVPPTVVPRPPMVPVAPVMAPPVPAAPAPKTPTASAPATPTPVAPAPAPTPPAATASQDVPRGTAGGPPPYTDSQVKALRGIGVSWRSPNGPRQATSDSNGVVSLGKLGQGSHELTVNQKSLGTGTGTQPNVQPVALIGLLLPAVQKAREGARRYETVVVRPVNDQPTLRIKIDVDAKGQVSTINSGNGIRVAVGDVNGDGRADIRLFEDLAKRNTSGETRLVFVAPVPGSSAAALADANNILQEVSTTRLGTSQGNAGTPGTPTAQEAAISTSRSNIKKPSLETASGGPEKPKPNYTNKPIPGVDIIFEKNSGGSAVTQITDGNGTTTLGVLTPGTHSVSLDTRKLLDARATPGTSGSAPAQPAGILVGLLLPAVQKLGEAPQPTTVEHSFPRSFLANASDLRIEIAVPEGGGSPKVDWGDRSPLTDVGRDGVPAPSGLRISADVSTLRISALSSPETVPGGPGTPTAQEAAISTTRSNIKRPDPAKLSNVGVTATGPGGARQMRSDSEGWTRFGKLPIGNTVLEFSGADLASALKTTGAPTTPTAQQTHIERLVVIAIIAIKTDGTPVVFTGSVPASAVKTLKADLRIGRDGNLMDVNWGNGPQLPQVLPRTGAATLTVPGPNGPIPVNPAAVKSLQDRAGSSAPGSVDANNTFQNLSSTSTR